MSEIKTGGPAFPVAMSEQTSTNQYGEPHSAGMTLRDWFATHCPESWLEDNAPKAVGDMRDMMVSKGILPPSAAKGDVLRAYDNTHRQRLMIALRWDYADAMLAAREGAA